MIGSVSEPDFTYSSNSTTGSRSAAPAPPPIHCPLIKADRDRLPGSIGIHQRVQRLRSLAWDAFEPARRLTALVPDHPALAGELFEIDGACREPDRQRLELRLNHGPMCFCEGQVFCLSECCWTFAIVSRICNLLGNLFKP